jgi:DNA processing protein
MELEHSLSWLALGVTPGLASRLTAKLLRRFGTPEAVFRASLTDLEACQIPPAVAQAIHSQTPLKTAEKELEKVRASGCLLLNWTETAYPQRLLEIYDPPPLLYVRGDLSVLNRHAISIVGTRRPTPYGNQMAERLARDLAERGLVIVSGLARGIDSSAHTGACAAARGATVGVLGNGIDVVYPKENKKLFSQVAGRGAIITEFPFGSHPAPENFPVRNRIIAGMTLGTVVVEGAEHSGSAITVRLAMEYSREAFGVPGNATQPNSFVPNQLIKQGAKLVTGWEDVVEELPTGIRTELFAVESLGARERASLFEESLSPSQKLLYGLLSTDEPRHVDELVECSELSSSEVLATLFDLEMKGMIRQMPGKQFVKVLL